MSAPPLADLQNSVFHTKEIKFRGQTLTIILQNENGPCPLIAICNILALRKEIRWPSAPSGVPLATLLNSLVGHLYERGGNNHDPERDHMLDEAVKAIPLLQYGLDVNVRFRNSEDYEFNAHTVVLDLLRIRLVHGWVIDPQNALLLEAVGSNGYNQLQDMFVGQQHSPDATVTPHHEVINEFLSTTPSQMTTYGLFQLTAKIGEDDLAMLFRANHFSVICKYHGALYTLVTDIGYQRHSNAIWERIIDAEGLGVMVDEMFCSPEERRRLSTPMPEVYARPVMGGPLPRVNPSPQPPLQTHSTLGHPAAVRSRQQHLPNPNDNCACVVL
jgi:hypothetical protein